MKMLRGNRSILSFASTAVLVLFLHDRLVLEAAAFPLQKLEVGHKAPELSLEDWIDVEGGSVPFLENKKVILLVFWRSDSHRCHIWLSYVQRLSERLLNPSFALASVSYETQDTLGPFMKERGYTFPVASDPMQENIMAYKAFDCPVTYVVAKGKIAYAGCLAGAEAAVERALGCKPRPVHGLTNYLNFLESGELEEARASLQTLSESEGFREYNLRSWARIVGGEGAQRKEEMKAENAAEVLAGLSEAWREGNLIRTKDDLDSLASWGAERFDLQAWALDVLAKKFPLTPGELSKLLSAGMRRSAEYERVLDILLDRNPSEEALTMAMEHRGLQGFCKSRRGEFFMRNGRIGLMRLHWVLGDKKVPEEKRAEFEKELGSSAPRGSRGKPGKPSSPNLAKAYELDQAGLPGFIRRQFALAELVEGLLDKNVWSLDRNRIWMRAEKREKKDLLDLMKKYL